MSLILGIETSCDESSSAVVHYSENKLQTLGIATFSQIEIHQPYGGVVPEIASRNHLETLQPMIEESLKQAGLQYPEIDAFAVTNRPGLVGALLVGVSAAKAIAYALDKPLVPIHHLEGHIASLFLDQSEILEDIESMRPLPLLVAVVSGGHTHLHVVKDPPSRWSPSFLKDSLVGRSRDDAAGEAFDKTAKLLGFPYPGGVWIDQTAQKGGNPKAFDFPRALPQKTVLDFSFSGLKTAVSLEIQKLKKNGELENRLHDLCASIQEAIVDSVGSKIKLAVQKYGCKSIAVVGGVAANSRLRKFLESEAPVPVLFPKSKYCTDNGAMIAAAGAFRFQQQRQLDTPSLLVLNAMASSEY